MLINFSKQAMIFFSRAHFLKQFHYSSSCLAYLLHIETACTPRCAHVQTELNMKGFYKGRSKSSVTVNILEDTTTIIENC